MKESRRSIIRKTSLLTVALTGTGTVSARQNEPPAWGRYEREENDEDDSERGEITVYTPDYNAKYAILFDESWNSLGEICVDSGSGSFGEHPLESYIIQIFNTEWEVLAQKHISIRGDTTVGFDTVPEENEDTQTEWSKIDDFDNGEFANGWKATNAWVTTDDIASAGSYSAFSDTEWSQMRWTGDPSFPHGWTLAFDFAFDETDDQQLNCYFGCDDSNEDSESYRLEIHRDSIGLMDTDEWSWIKGNDSYRNSTFKEFHTVTLTFTSDEIVVEVTGETDAIMSAHETKYNGEDIYFDIDMGGAYLDNVKAIENDGEEQDTTTEAPIEQYGQLQVHGTDLCDKDGNPVQLRGMSTHGIQWYGWDEYVTEDSLDVLATTWDSGVVRIALYVQEGGYETDPEGFTNEVNRIVEEVTSRGMYAIIDWHMLEPGDPMENLEYAKEFFKEVSREHADKSNILYEIANEPSGVSWERIREYAHEVIPVIRENDPDSVILVGTRGWSSFGLAEGSDAQEIVDNQVNAENVMYTFHFYAASHDEFYRNELEWAADRIPIFATEWGSMEYTGGGSHDFESAQAFVDLMEQENISWTNWNLKDVWEEETVEDESWDINNLTENGKWVYEQIRNKQ